MSVKTTVITGATSGIGRETALALAKQDHELYLLVRNTIKGERLKQDLITETGNNNIHIVKCNLSDLQSIKDAAAEIKEKTDTVNVLINNAGGIFFEKQLTKEGLEMTFISNHLGHFLLTLSLIPVLSKGEARVINLSSDAHKMGEANFDDLNWSQRKYSPAKAYGTSKLFNLYFSKSLAEKYAEQGITSFAVHPGVVKTGFGEGSTGLVKILLFLARPFMISPYEGAQTTIYLATEQGVESMSSQYFAKCKLAKSTVLSWSEVNRNKLWDISMKLLKGYLK